MKDVNCEPSRQLGDVPSDREAARSGVGLPARLYRLLGIGAVWCACASGSCGDDARPQTDAGIEQVVADGAAGGAGETAANAGAGSGVGKGAVDPPGATRPTTVPCGSMQCNAPSNVAGNLLRGVTGLQITVPDAAPCCVDEAEEVCGSASRAGVACDTPAAAEPSCPGIDLSALASLVGGLGKKADSAMIGCCTHGACGLDGALFGRGCVENADAKRMLGNVPIVGALITVPPPAACAAHGDDNDAGAD
jgi:hypothetical protein